MILVAGIEEFFSETMRKYPLAPFLVRVNTEAYLFEKSGLVIDKNTPILIPTFAFHYNENMFPNPEIFNPERFDKENKGLILSFGMGPRSCIGTKNTYIKFNYLTYFLLYF